MLLHHARVGVAYRFLARTINGTPFSRVFSKNSDMRQAYRVGVRSNCRDSEGAWFRICNLTTAQLNARPRFNSACRIPICCLLMTAWKPTPRAPAKTKEELREMLAQAVRNTQAETEPKPLPKPKKGRR